MFPTIVTCSTLRTGPYLFYIEKFITQFKTLEKNNRSPYSFLRKWRFTSMARSSRKEKAAFLMRALITREIMRSRDAQMQYWWMTLRLPCASVSKRVLVNNLSYENKFALYENEHARETHFQMSGSTPRLVLTQRQKTIRNGLLSSNRLPTIYHLPKYIVSLSCLYILRHVGYENQDINHCVTRLFVRFRYLTGNLSRLQFAITACSTRTLIPISRKASYRVPRSTLAL